MEAWAVFIFVGEGVSTMGDMGDVDAGR